MKNIEKQLDWEKGAKDKFDRMIERIPLFHRAIAKEVVVKKANINAKDRGSSVVEESDIVEGFLTEVPKAFYSLMIRLFDEVDFN